MTDVVVPNSYEQWLGMMKSHAKEVLSKESINKRIKVLSSSSNPETKQFVDLYGEEHRQKVVAWFQQASQEF